MATDNFSTVTFPIHKELYKFNDDEYNGNSRFIFIIILSLSVLKKQER